VLLAHPPSDHPFKCLLREINRAGSDHGILKQMQTGSTSNLGCCVRILSTRCLCRTGDTIYVDYLRQFSGEKAPRAAPGTASRSADAGGAHGSTPGGGADAAGSRKGRWSTVGGGKARFVHSSFSMRPAAAQCAVPHGHAGDCISSARLCRKMLC
jgi:hypothetical protein